MLRNLQLCDFRCFARLAFEPEPVLNLIVGANAQGKTSLLEAACVLLRLQSPRTNHLAEAVRVGTAGFGLAAEWGDRTLHMQFKDSLKSFRLDAQHHTRPAEYLSVARVVWISNDDEQLVRGSAAVRRRFLDFLAAQASPGYLRQLRAYERALRSRNVLLREGRARREISAFDGVLLESGKIITEIRRQLSAALDPLAHEAAHQISAEGEHLQISYHPGSPEDFATALAASADEEVRLRMTLVGPHRDDLDLVLNGMHAASYASEGQRRSIALALKLAQARHLAALTGPPLYLIDDIFGELDPDRRNRVMKLLPNAAQKLVTATSLDWMERELPAAVFRLADRHLRRVA